MESTKEVYICDLKIFNKFCFNPYFHGIYKRGKTSIKKMVDLKEFQSLFSWNLQKRCFCFNNSSIIPSCFNPYFHGIYKRGADRERSLSLSLCVSILIFMESTKEATTRYGNSYSTFCFNPYFHGIYKRGILRIL